jgi:hypothetical protein
MALAARSMGEEARRVLVEMARVWTRLADEQDRTFSPSAPEVAQPAMQQQQQIQPKKDK